MKARCRFKMRPHYSGCGCYDCMLGRAAARSNFLAKAFGVAVFAVVGLLLYCEAVAARYGAAHLKVLTH